MSTSGIFTGASAYASDFSSMIDRAVTIASLPIKQMTADQTELSNQAGDLQTIQSKFAALQSSLNGIAAALDGSSFLTSVQDAAVASATVSSGAVEGNYSILVEEIGAHATSLSKQAWEAASGPAHTYDLMVGVDRYSFTPADNSAAGVAAALNFAYGDKVRASVVNVGSTAAPDYRISLQNVKLGDAPVQLLDGATELQDHKVAGRLARYEVNGSGVHPESDTRTVSIATGLTVTLLSAGATPADITVTRSTSALSEALTGFADAYNAAAAELDRHRGIAGGNLQGDALIAELANVLSALGTYSSGSATVAGLPALGLELGLEGRLSFASFTLLSADMLNSNGVTNFLGSPSTGGFLKFASDRLKALQDPEKGLISLAVEDFDQRISRVAADIEARQVQVDRFQERLINQIAAADSLIAGMQQQYTYLASMFDAMRASSESY